MMNDVIMNVLAQLNGMKIETVCFTGSRPNKLRGYVKDSYVPFVDTLTEVLTYLHDTFGTSKYISGGAQGMDQLSFWSVERLKNIVADENTVKNILHKPFDGQEGRWLRTGLFSQHEYNLMCRCADETVVVDSKVSPDDYRQVCRALDNRNHSMVDISDLVIALYEDDGWHTAQHSGTANCMQYAHAQHKPILQLMYEKSNDVTRPLIITGATLYL